MSRLTVNNRARLLLWTSSIRVLRQQTQIWIIINSALADNLKTNSSRTQTTKLMQMVNTWTCTMDWTRLDIMSWRKTCCLSLSTQTTRTTMCQVQTLEVGLLMEINTTRCYSTLTLNLSHQREWVWTSMEPLSKHHCNCLWTWTVNPTRCFSS